MDPDEDRYPVPNLFLGAKYPITSFTDKWPDEWWAEVR